MISQFKLFIPGGHWTVDKLKDMIALLKWADFDPTVIDTDLHKRVADAIQDWFIRRFDMVCE